MIFLSIANSKIKSQVLNKSAGSVQQKENLILIQD
jgi:hypothetical protein